MSAQVASPRTSANLEALGRAGASVALIGAAMVHSTVVTDHYREWALAGLFFLALLAAQTFLGLAVLLAPGRRVATAVVAVNLATIAVWEVSRTTGMPFGPMQFRRPDQVTAPDVACVLLELLAVVVICVAHRRRRPEVTAAWPGRPPE